MPPVNEPSPFVDISQAQLEKHFVGLHIINLWKQLFTYDELTENVRQRSDQEFVNILSNIRLGILTDDDYKVLSKRIIDVSSETTEGTLANLISYIAKLPKNTVCLFPTRDQCREVNVAMLNQIKSETVVLMADDSIEARNPQEKEKALKKLANLQKTHKFSHSAG